MSPRCTCDLQHHPCQFVELQGRQGGEERADRDYQELPIDCGEDLMSGWEEPVLGHPAVGRKLLKRVGAQHLERHCQQDSLLSFFFF